jgi:FtsK/SpoIIIE family
MTDHQLQIGFLGRIKREALVPYDSSQAIVISHDAESQTMAAELCEGIVLQLLMAHPVNSAQVQLYEVVPSPQFAQLKRLLVNAEEFGGQLTSLKTCTDLLTRLEERMHYRYKLLASAEEANIAGYNAKGKIQEVITYLVITDVTNLIHDEHARQNLERLCQQGPNVGLVPVLLKPPALPEVEPVSEFKHKRLEAFWNTIIPKTFGFDVQQNQVQLRRQSAELWRLFHKFEIQFGLSPELRKQYANTLLEQAQAAQADDTNQDFLEIPIGIEGANRATFRLGEASNAYHALLGGTTRSGKSTLLNNLILQACETFTPEELRLWLFDYREGVEFNLFEGLPHLDALHLNNTDKTYAQDAFNRFVQQMDDRGKLFRAAPGRITNLAEYNRQASQPLPRCIMIVDEAQSLFEDRESKIAAKKMLQAVSRKGAAFGLHVILSTQSYRNVELEADVQAQFRLRIGLQLSNAMECRALMGRDNDAPMNVPRYTAVYNNNYGEIGDNQIIALDPLEDFDQRLQRLHERYVRTEFPAPQVQEVKIESEVKILVTGQKSDPCVTHAKT